MNGVKVSGIIQKIKTILIPEIGLDLQPKDVVEAEVSTDFSRTFAHLVGKGYNSGVLIRATSDGRLYVATAGVAFEVYAVENGTSLDAFNALHTYEQVHGQLVTDILIETHPAIISFRNQAHVWGDEKAIPVGVVSIDLVHYGIRVRNRNAGDNSVYEITMYR